MAAIRFDPGGRVPTPTVTTGRTTLARASHVSPPDRSAPEPGPLRTSQKGIARFTQHPIAYDTRSLRDVIRSNSTTSSTLTIPATLPAWTTLLGSHLLTPVVNRPNDASAAVPAPVSNANDGRAERLNPGYNMGTRDARIAALNEAKAVLESRESQIEGQIEMIEHKIESDERTTQIVKTGINFVTVPVGTIAGLFGMSNPISDAAGAVTENILGLEQQRDTLKAQEKELDATQAEIEAEIRKLKTEQVLNFLADAARVTDMDDKVVKFIEDGKSKVGHLDVTLQVTGGTRSGSDGVFDATDNTITVDDKILEGTRDEMEKLQRQGIVDGDGNIVDARAFDASTEGDAVIKTVSLIGVHEYNHAVQHAQDRFAPAFTAKRAVAMHVLADLIQVGGITEDRDRAAAVTAAAVAGETERTRQIEVESYRLQEQNDLRSGAKKKAFITIDEQGHPLPEAQQLANVVAYQAATPLPYGPTAGYEREGNALAVTGIIGDEHENGASETAT